MLAGGKRRRSRGGANGNGRKEPNRRGGDLRGIGYARGGDDNTFQGGMEDGAVYRPVGSMLPRVGSRPGDGLIARRVRRQCELDVELRRLEA